MNESHSEKEAEQLLVISKVLAVFVLLHCIAIRVS